MWTTVRARSRKAFDFQSVDYIALYRVELFKTVAVASSDVNGLWALFKQYIYKAIERFEPLRKNHTVYGPRTILNYHKYILCAQKRKLIMWRNRHAPGGHAECLAYVAFLRPPMMSA